MKPRSVSELNRMQDRTDSETDRAQINERLDGIDVPPSGGRTGIMQFAFGAGNAQVTITSAGVDIPWASLQENINPSLVSHANNSAEISLLTSGVYTFSLSIKGAASAGNTADAVWETNIEYWDGAVWGSSYSINDNGAIFRDTHLHDDVVLGSNITAVDGSIRVVSPPLNIKFVGDCTPTQEISIFAFEGQITILHSDRIPSRD